ncbi:MAG: hypothetical protein A3K19_31390 [Lentisphaerae bacterium RIFOXYB12_FULL_65_16]|nr:MAG: hypothetical protein A3K18_10185 [Lentisphaerae bacterium RIFOXYA12_64_32]OGV88550.1 MAG: hypothetical protein A3K19_31390 [Lentisphaerae bacterium RIFOXYB12_FULL_65_16]
MLLHTLVAVDNKVLERRMSRLLRKPGVWVTTVPSLDDAKSSGVLEDCDLVVISHSLLKEPPAATITELRKLPDRPEVLVLRDVENGYERARLLAAGACAVALSEVPDETLGALIEHILERREEDMVTRLGAERGGIRPIRLSDFVSQSPAMHAFMETVHRVVSADNSLLILGETGVGKEHLARAIHSESPRANGSFIAVNCGALPEALLESELFGHEKGAFTGADRAVRGQFELAHRGTIFLDEIGEMPVHLQVKLLQVLERRQIRRVGGEQLIAVDVRIIAATNRNLTAEIEAGRFRKDLFYRLGAVVLTIPPLRDRREDIPELVENYLQYFRVNTGQPIKGIDSGAIAALVKHSWPGNVRELINIMERAVLLCRGDTIRPVDLPTAIVEETPANVPVAAAAGGSVASAPELPAEWLGKPLREARRMAMDRFERVYLTQLLTETRGRVGETARRAGMTTRSLYDRMRRLGLSKESFRRNGSPANGAATDEDDPEDPVQVPAA